MHEIVRTTSNNDDFQHLVKLLDLELRHRYEELQAQYDKHNKIEKNETVVLVYSGAIPVGCGCFKQHDNVSAEIKRMYVSPEERRHGIAYNIVNELCSWAKEYGFRKMILETGKKQPEAIRLYEKSGFYRIDNYAPYVGMEQSVCMAKEL
jgi:putative acetyltransferase